jgi:endonuclease-8
VPEGDTIHRAAATLAGALVGERVTSVDAPRARTHALPRAGETVTSVEARGKHLLIAFDGGLVLHTHMRMTGSWHVYPSGSRWRRSRSAVVARIGTPRLEAVCFSAPVVEVLREAEVRGHPVLASLGPDLCEPEPDLDEAMRRLDRLLADDPTVPVGAALLDQTVASGVGNVYRAEVAWACEVHPATPAATLAPSDRRRLWATASALLRANLGTARRTTVPGGLAVYDRTGRPCPRCGSAIETGHLRSSSRRVWWCPACQR